MRQRIIVGLIAGGLLVASIFINAWVFTVVLVAAMCVGMAEMYSALKKGGYRPVQLPGYLCAVLLLPAYRFFSYAGPLMLIIFSSILTASATVFSEKVKFSDISMTLFTYVYPLMPFTVILFMALIDKRNLRYLILMQLFAYTYASDSFAYFTGRFFGKRKLCERLSPKKTVEGAIGGIIGSLLVGIISYVICDDLFLIRYDAFHYLMIAFICGIAGSIGDLFASAIKRYVGIKDYGTIFPGHGGLMDRVDSILFAAPFVYFYYILIGLITVK